MILYPRVPRDVSERPQQKPISPRSGQHGEGEEGRFPATAATLWLAFSGAGPSEWIPALALLTGALTGGYQAAGTLLSTLRLTTGRLRQERPLHTDKEVSLSEIRRMFIGGGRT